MADWSTDTEEEYEADLVTPSPKKKRKAFSAQLQRSGEKPVPQMSPRERSRRTENYVHPTKCCKRKRCYEHIADSTVRAIRSRVWNEYGDKPRQAKIEIARVWDEIFLIDGKRCCIEFILNAFGVSRTFLYPDTRKKPKIRASDVRESIIIFFEELKLDSDSMPDAEEFHLYAPKKASIFEMYCERPGSVPCGIQYFLKQWRLLFPEVKLRKYLRFTKCNTCEELKQVHTFLLYPFLCLISFSRF